MTSVSLLGCAGTREAARTDPTDAALYETAPPEERDFVLAGGFIHGKMTIPAGSIEIARPVIVNPLLDPARLLARGAVVVRYHLNWESIPTPQPPTESAAERKARNPVGTWLLASPSAAVIGRGYFQLTWSAGKSAKRVCEYLATLPFVDPDRIGMAGMSTNGFKVFSALLAGTPLRAAVVVAACADYHSFLRGSPIALNGASLDLDPAYESWLRAHEPVRHASRFTDTALLTVNGGEDHVIPTDCVDLSAPILRREYERAGGVQRFRQAWFSDATHNELVDRADAEILAWWVRWLGLDDLETAGEDAPPR